MFSEIIFLAVSLHILPPFFCIALFIVEGNETSFPPIMNNTACEQLPIQELHKVYPPACGHVSLDVGSVSSARLGIDRPRLKSTFSPYIYPLYPLYFESFFFNSLNVFC